jgi:hypothetical protein
MKQLNVFLATLVLTGFAFLPATTLADELDDLEVTMDVMDDIADVDDAIALMEGPGNDDIEDDMGDDSLDDDHEEESDHGEIGDVESDDHESDEESGREENDHDGRAR